MIINKVRIARNVIRQSDYRSKRIDAMGREIAYWVFRRESSKTFAEKTYCSKMVAMYISRQKWYVVNRRTDSFLFLSEDDKDKILAFIGNFRKHQDFYLEGFCYYFAVILRERFSSPDDGSSYKVAIWYNPVLNHFSCWINGVLFDAQGVISSTDNWLPWSAYREIEPLDSSRTITYCILK